MQSFTEIFNDYQGELRSSMCRKEWYSRFLGTKPSIPRIIHYEERPILQGEYIVFAPFSAWKNRSWHIGAWLYLECLIKEKLGMQTAILDGPGDGARTSCFQGFRIWGYPPDTVINLIRNARCTIANDSMIAHLGGLLGTKTIAIVAQIEVKKLFSMTEINAITGGTPCTGCNFQYEKGYRNGCDHECFSLNSISPFRVFEKLKEIVS